MGIKEVKIFFIGIIVIILIGCANLNKNPYEVMTQEEIVFSEKLFKLLNSEYNEKQMLELFGSVQEKIRIPKHSATDFHDPFKPGKGQIRFYVHNNKINRMTWVRIGENNFIWDPSMREKFMTKNKRNHNQDTIN